MCGRYWTDDSEEFREFVAEMNRSPLADRWREKKKEIRTGGEILPTDVAPVIAPDRRGGRKIYPMKWGFAGRSLLINARAETAAVKETFREAWHRRRCIIPAAGYFEWEHLTESGGKKRSGDKFLIRPAKEGLTYLCGLYRIEEGMPVFVVLTREPAEEIRFIHNRMPLILPGELVNEWIRPDADPEGILKNAVTDVHFERLNS